MAAKKKTKAKTKKKPAKTRKPGDLGLAGNTGLIGGGIHLNMSYDANSDSTVFVGDWSEGSWERMSAAQAKKKKLTPIKCSYCSEPATRLDHMWPYCSGSTACKKHLDRHDAD